MGRDFIVSKALVYDSITKEAFYSNSLSLKCNKLIDYNQNQNENLSMLNNLDNLLKNDIECDCQNLFCHCKNSNCLNRKNKFNKNNYFKCVIFSNCNSNCCQPFYTRKCCKRQCNHNLCN